MLEKDSQVPNKLLEDIMLFLLKYAAVLLVECLGENVEITSFRVGKWHSENEWYKQLLK